MNAVTGLDIGYGYTKAASSGIATPPSVIGPMF